MENTAYVLVSIALLFLALILMMLTFLIYKLLKDKNSTQASHAPHERYAPAILERMKEIEKLRPKRSELFCPNHPDEPGETTCAICDRFFCKACIKPFKALHFCKEHIPLIMRHDWDEVLTVKTSTSDPEEGVRLYDIKKEIFQKNDLPTYIETHYKINVDQDYIETYLVLHGIREHVTDLKEKLRAFI